MQVPFNELFLRTPHRDGLAEIHRARRSQHRLHSDFLPIGILSIETVEVVAHDEANPLIGLVNPHLGWVITLIHHHHIPVL